MERLRAHAAARGGSLFEALADAGWHRGGEAPGAPGPGRAARRPGGARRHGGRAGRRRRGARPALQRSGLLGRLEAERTDEAEERGENLVELVAAAREFDEQLADQPPSHDPDEPVPPPALARFLEQIALLGEADAETPEGRVALMTLHAAKGLEFDAVFLAGAGGRDAAPRAPLGRRLGRGAAGRRGRGAAALLRGHDPGQAAADALAGAAAHELQRGGRRLPRHGAVALPRRPAAGALRPPAGPGRGGGGPRAGDPAPPRRAPGRAAHRGGWRGRGPGGAAPGASLARRGAHRRLQLRPAPRGRRAGRSPVGIRSGTRCWGRGRCWPATASGGRPR